MCVTLFHSPATSFHCDSGSGACTHAWPCVNTSAALQTHVGLHTEPASSAHDFSTRSSQSPDFPADFFPFQNGVNIFFCFLFFNNPFSKCPPANAVQKAWCYRLRVDCGCIKKFGQHWYHLFLWKVSSVHWRLTGFSVCDFLLGTGTFQINFADLKEETLLCLHCDKVSPSPFTLVSL